MDQEHKWIREIVRHGSRSASDALVRRYYDEVYAFIYRQVRDREDALDLTQESFVAALRGLPSYDRKKAGFRTWLFSIAAHKVIDARRRAGPLQYRKHFVCIYTAAMIFRRLRGSPGGRKAA